MSLFLVALKWELGKLFGRRRTQFAFLALLGFEMLIIAMLQNPAVQEELKRTFHRVGYTFPENFTGPTIAAFAAANAMTILGNLITALAAGEIVAKEIEDGTMRMLLCRPIGRARVLAAKLVTCLLFTGVISTFICLSTLALGLLYRGPGYWLILEPKESFVAQHQFWPGLGRYLAAIVLLTVSSSCVTILAFTLSCLKMKPAAATVLALATFIVDDTLRNLPFFASVKPYFIVSRVVVWLHVFDRRIPWGLLLHDYAILLSLYLVTAAIGWIAFMRRDIKS